MMVFETTQSDLLHLNGKGARMIERASETCERIAQEYGVARSAVVWAGGSKFIVVKDGKETWVVR